MQSASDLSDLLRALEMPNSEPELAPARRDCCAGSDESPDLLAAATAPSSGTADDDALAPFVPLGSRSCDWGVSAQEPIDLSSFYGRLVCVPVTLGGSEMMLTFFAEAGEARGGSASEEGDTGEEGEHDGASGEESVSSGESVAAVMVYAAYCTRWLPPPAPPPPAPPPVERPTRELTFTASFTNQSVVDAFVNSPEAARMLVSGAKALFVEEVEQMELPEASFRPPPVLDPFSPAYVTPQCC